MNNFNWTKALGFGVVIWAAMTAVLWILGSVESIGPLWAHGITAALGGISALYLASNANPESGTQAAEYGLVFAAVILALDLIATQWFDAHVFASWQYWLGPALAFLAPWVQTETRQQLAHSV
jgi:hypothetical protein